MSVDATTVLPLKAPEPQTQQPKPQDSPQDAPPPAAAEKKPDEFSSKFAALAKKERLARQTILQAKQREQQLAERERLIAERERAWEDEFRSSPLDALKKRNLSYEDLTKAALNNGRFEADVEIKNVRDEISKFKLEQEQKEKERIEAQRQAQEQEEAQAIESYKGRIDQFLKANTEKYELTALYEATDLVFTTIEKNFETTNKVLSTEEACQLVEEYLESELDKTAKTKKFQSKFASLLAKEGEQKPNAQGAKAPKTLTNEFNSVSATMLPAHTENERIKRALAALG
jgi:hypothetical protein